MNVDGESSGSSIGSGNSGNRETYHRESDEQKAKRLRLQKEEDQLIIENNQKIFEAIMAAPSEILQIRRGLANTVNGSNCSSQSEYHILRETEEQVAEREEEDKRMEEKNRVVLEAILAYSSENESVSESAEQDATRVREILESNEIIFQSIIDDSPPHEDGGGSRGFDSGNDDYSLEYESVGEGNDEEPYDDISIEEGSLQFGEESEYGVSPPQRKRTHIEDEEALQKNLLLMMRRLHMDKIRIESLRLCPLERTCSMCGVTNQSRLWRCNECSMVRFSSAITCGECMEKNT
jgi:hypothetical protein